MYICIKEQIMEETQNQIVENSGRKKKKFVYLDKYEMNKDRIDEKIKFLELSINICYVLIAALSACLIIAFFK